MWEDTFTLTVGFEFMPGAISPDLIDYFVGEIPVEAEMRFNWDPSKLSLLNGSDLLFFDAPNGIGTFDLYAPDGELTLQFEALMVTDPTTAIHVFGIGFYEEFSCPAVDCLPPVVYAGGSLVPHPEVGNTAYVTITSVPEPSTLALPSLGLLVGAAFRKRFK